MYGCRYSTSGWLRYTIMNSLILVYTLLMSTENLHSLQFLSYNVSVNKPAQSSQPFKDNRYFDSFYDNIYLFIILYGEQNTEACNKNQLPVYLNQNIKELKDIAYILWRSLPVGLWSRAWGWTVVPGKLVTNIVLL